ncbi:anion-transporting ATPase-like domain-containing protein [Haematococcus lacustris]
MLARGTAGCCHGHGHGHRPTQSALAPLPSSIARPLQGASCVAHAHALDSYSQPSSSLARAPVKHRRNALLAKRTLQICSSALVDSPSTSCFDELAAGTERRYVMISGKGGVGKTSLSASLAVKLAAAGHSVLVVSTDPAHSLSDSLGQDVSGGKPVLVQGTDLPLWGLEIDPEEAKAEFMTSSAKNNTGSQVQDFMRGMGMGMIADQLADLKLGELLDTPPPGLDEAVAIAKVVQFVDSADYTRFTRIIFDTAPTGHTLRLLALPDFVEASLAKIIRLRKKLASATAVVRSLFGTGESQDEAVAKLEKLQGRIKMVKQLFRDKQTTEFIIATIPTYLGVNESARLLQSLRKEGIPCKRIIVNQVIGPGQGDAYLRMKLKDQSAAIKLIESDPALTDLRKVQAPLIDLEVRRVPALGYFGSVVWRDVFDAMNSGAERKYFLLGGKGGVGKTSCSAALAVRFASEGLPTLVVSTDPAHSLSDAFDQSLSGGKPVAISSPMGDLPLWGMEISPEQARAELRQVMADDGGQKLNQVLDSLGLSAVADQLKDLQLGELLDTPPPGVDEAVAISKVVQFLKAPEYAHFKRIIFDTAPTGHTLRLLSLPDFLDVSIGKLVRLRQKLSLSAVKNFFTGSSSKDPAVEKLEELKARMAEARDLFRNQATTEFVIVTIPTVMAAAESCRLATALHKEGIPIKTIVVNQVLQQNATDKFLSARRADQQRALAHLHEDAGLDGLQVITGPLFDLEVRGVPALTYFGNQVWK